MIFGWFFSYAAISFMFAAVFLYVAALGIHDVLIGAYEPDDINYITLLIILGIMLITFGFLMLFGWFK